MKIHRIEESPLTLYDIHRLQIAFEDVYRDVANSFFENWPNILQACDVPIFADSYTYEAVTERGRTEMRLVYTPMLVTHSYDIAELRQAVHFGELNSRKSVACRRTVAQKVDEMLECGAGDMYFNHGRIDPKIAEAIVQPLEHYAPYWGRLDNGGYGVTCVMTQRVAGVAVYQPDAL